MGKDADTVDGYHAEELQGASAPDAANVTYTPAVATDWDSDADPGNTDDALDQLAERVDDLEGAPAPSAGEGHLTILAMSYSGYGGTGTWSMQGSTSAYQYHYLRLDSAADGDYINYEAFLAVGTYTILVVYGKNTNYGIVDIDFAGSEVASLDAYGSPSSHSNRALLTSISVTTAGVKQIRLRIHGKNASSIGYSFGLSYMALWRTA